MVTAYDKCFASIASKAGIDALLVGDSLGMVLQGHSSTLPVTVDDISYHTRCVSAASSNCLIISDVPFLASATIQDAVDTARALIQAGANVVKIEGGSNLTNLVNLFRRSGCSHMLPSRTHATIRQPIWWISCTGANQRSCQTSDRCSSFTRSGRHRYYLARMCPKPRNRRNYEGNRGTCRWYRRRSICKWSSAGNARSAWYHLR